MFIAAAGFFFMFLGCVCVLPTLSENIQILTNIQPEIVHSHKFSHNILIFREDLYFATGFVLLSVVCLIFVSKGPSTVLNFK